MLRISYLFSNCSEKFKEIKCNGLKNDHWYYNNYKIIKYKLKSIFNYFNGTISSIKNFKIFIFLITSQNLKKLNLMLEYFSENFQVAISEFVRTIKLLNIDSFQIV